MKCLNCDNDAIGRSKYCSDKCKVAYNRNKRNGKSVTSVTENKRNTETVTPEGIKQEVPANFGLENCECRHCRTNRNNGGKHIINHGEYKTAKQLKANEVNRVSLPGDVDYVVGKWGNSAEFVQWAQAREGI